MEVQAGQGGLGSSSAGRTRGSWYILVYTQARNCFCYTSPIILPQFPLIASKNCVKRKFKGILITVTHRGGCSLGDLQTAVFEVYWQQLVSISTVDFHSHQFAASCWEGDLKAPW